MSSVALRALYEKGNRTLPEGKKSASNRDTRVCRQDFHWCQLELCCKEITVM